MLFQDMEGAVSRYGKCCFEIWEVLILLVRSGDWWIGGLLVSVPASGSSDQSLSLTHCTIFGSRSVNHETFRDIRSTCREGGIRATVSESRTIPRYVSCCQSRTFPMYIAFWQLHSHLYLENSRVIWDSVLLHVSDCAGKIFVTY